MLQLITKNNLNYNVNLWHGFPVYIKHGFPVNTKYTMIIVNT